MATVNKQQHHFYGKIPFLGQLNLSHFVVTIIPLNPNDTVEISNQKHEIIKVSDVIT